MEYTVTSSQSSETLLPVPEKSHGWFFFSGSRSELTETKDLALLCHISCKRKHARSQGHFHAETDI